MFCSESQGRYEMVTAAVSAIENYIAGERYAGYDPYDCLGSPLFQLPVLRTNKIVRLVAQQTLKRLPVNIRPFLGIRKGFNPVTLGLCVQAFTNLLTVFPDKQMRLTEGIDFCIRELVRLQSTGYGGPCWGYDFNWEARYARIPAYTPTVVATGFITNGLFQNYMVTGNALARDLCVRAAGFVTKDLQKTYSNGLFCYSYSPHDRNVVLNATMKGARLLAQAYALTGDPGLRDEAKATVQFVVQHQRENGSWPYSLGDTRSWSDNFHTGYVLDCLDEYMKLTRDEAVKRSLVKGLQYYVDHYFEGGRIPKYFDSATFPVDATAGAQSILTLLRFGHIQQAGDVASWMICNMQDPKGFFYYQKHRWYTNRISYMRWSNAWMFLALSSLLKALGGQRAESDGAVSAQRLESSIT